MKRINIIICSLVFLLIPFCAFAIKDPVQSMSSYSSDVESHILGIWQNQDDPRYYYEFKPSGEYIRYKINNNGGSSKKLFGKYKMVDSLTLVITINGNSSECEIHFDNNYNSLIILSYEDGEYSNGTVCKRIGITQFKKIIEGINWNN